MFENSFNSNALPVPLLRQVYVGLFFCTFSVSFFSFFFRLLVWPLGALLAPTWPVLAANLAPKTLPKSRFLRVQEASYLKIAEEVKI